MVLVSSACLSRLPVFPSVAVVRSQHSGAAGDTITSSFQLKTLADHLRYERHWGSGHPAFAFLIDASHALILLTAGTLVAMSVLVVIRTIPRRIRASVERSVRHAMVWACGCFFVVVSLKFALQLGVVRGSRPVLLALVGLTLAATLTLAVWGRPAPWSRVGLRIVLTLLLGLPLIASLLTLFALFDGRRLGSTVLAWVLGAALFLACKRVTASAPGLRSRSELR